MRLCAHFLVHLYSITFVVAAAATYYYIIIYYIDFKILMKIIFIIASYKQEMHKSAAKIMKLMIWMNEWMEVKGETRDTRCCQFIYF